MKHETIIPDKFAEACSGERHGRIDFLAHSPVTLLELELAFVTTKFFVLLWSIG